MVSPRFNEVFIVVLEAGERVVFNDVVLGEVLDDDEDKEVEHDVADHHDEG